MRNLERTISSLLERPAKLIESQELSGGCISRARRVRVDQGKGSPRDYFVKTNDPSFMENFRAECDGLERLARAAAIRVPHPIALDIHEGQAWLVLEWIEQGAKPGDFFERFGRSLASLHRQTQGQEIGLEINNFLGAAPQINTPANNWVRFVSEHRLGFQMRWAAEQGLDDASLRRDVGSIILQLDQWLSGSEPTTSLLHGDLWSGNCLCDSTAAPVLVDPAVYRGNREAEFGMLKLFGACPHRFYEAYDEAFPLPDGWQRRVNVYVLYHLLNHLNLFGRGYLRQCVDVAGQILRAE